MSHTSRDVYHFRRPSQSTLFVAFSVFCITLMAAKCKGSSETAATSKVFHHVKKLADGNLEFSLSLYEKMLSQDKNGNVFFSPFSITVALQMVHVGARNTTAKELKQLMKLHKFSKEEDMHGAFSDVLQSLNPEKQSSVILQTANQIYVQEKFEIIQEYAQTLLQHYQASASEADFVTNAEKTRNDINKWVEEKTRQKIKNLIPQGALNALTRMVIVNAIYFKGNWAKKFDPQDTFDGEFHRKTNDVVKTKLMRQKAKFPFVKNYDLGCKMVELCYVGDRLAMYILLPKEVEGLEALEKQLTPVILKSMMESLMEQKVKIILPKFKLEKGLPLSDVLKAIGIQQLFSESDADLTGISSKEGLHVSDVFHKAFVEVNEEGTEAAAATGMVIMTRAFVKEPEFIGDHPFLFFIYDKESELVLFLGRLTDPSVEIDSANSKVEL